MDRIPQTWVDKDGVREYFDGDLRWSDVGRWNDSRRIDVVANDWGHGSSFHWVMWILLPNGTIAEYHPVK